MRCPAAGAALLAVLTGVALTGASQPSTPPASRQADAPLPGALSPRNASYSIDARLDRESRHIVGTEHIRWRNIGQAPATDLRLHLYWNAWRNISSTWMRERMLPGAGASLANRPADDWSFIELTAVTLVAGEDTTGVDLLPALAYVHPDDGNGDDRTLASVPLPAPVAPGESISLRVGWTARVPRTFARTGVIGDYYFIAHWFPKLAVFEGTGWTAHQFHANTEFFSDYGTYDVRLTVPTGWIVGATGVEQSRTDHGDGTSTHRYLQHDVHDFAWTTSPTYREYRERFEHPGLPPILMRLLLQPEHDGQQDRHFAATRATLRYYGEWYGPYPYDHITVIDPAYQSGAGGMEYPTLFTAGTRWLAPRQTNQPESVTIHEAGHQFWYGSVANNEVEDAWLDEGLNTFSEERVQSLVFQPNYRVERFFGGFLPWQFRSIPLNRASDGNGLNGYRQAAERDAQDTPSFRYWPGTHAQITYGKTALWLHTLERYLGWERLQPAMAAFFDRWKFRHPRPEDFFATVEESAGQDLDWFFDNVYRSSNTFDYGVERLESQPLRRHGFATEGNGPTFEERILPDTYRTIVVVRRFGEAFFPVDVLTVFADGHEIREQWDGLDRWRTFTYDRPARAVSVQVDPERVLLLDVDYTNNSRTLTPRAEEAARKWSLAWMVWLQDLLLTYGFFV